MAHSEKYYHAYCNYFGVSCRVSVLQDDFVGSAIELEGQEIPFTKSYDSSSGFKFDPIRPSKGQCNFVFGTSNGVDFDELWTADEREFKVEHYIDGDLDWVGYVIPNGFQYEFIGGLYYATVTASDGLSSLESMPFAYNDGSPYGTQDLTYNNGFEFPFILIATEILRKLELDLNTWTCIDVYERSMTKTGDTRDADPLATSYANVKTYINDSDRKDIPYWADANEVLNCNEVLKNLCYLFGAKVYQNKGVWRIKRVNADANYGTGTTQRYWRKYNTLSVYLGRETINNEVTIPCTTVEKAMIGNNHAMSMDDVYGDFRMNYKYQLIRLGDTPLNLLPNGDFSVFNNTSKLAAPDGWFRWRDGKNWHMQLAPVDISSEAPGGYTTGIKLGDQATGMDDSKLDWAARRWNSIRNIDPVGVTKGDRLFLNMWLKFTAFIPGNNAHLVVFRMMLKGNNGKNFFLRNVTDVTNSSFKEFAWIEDETDSGTKGDVFFVMSAVIQEGGGAEEDQDEYVWRQFKVELEEVPESGEIIFDIHGLAKLSGKSTDNYPKFLTYWRPKPDEEYAHYFPTRDFIDKGGPVPRVLMTGLELGRIPDPDEFAEKQYFNYRNPDNYSLEVEPIEVLNGDVNDPQHISRIIVPTNVSGQKNFWNTIDDKFSPSSLGLITVKSIMSLYIKPFKLLEGTIKSGNIDIDTRFEFEALPGVKFCIQRGTFNEKKNYLEDVTFFEISDDDIPAGGSEGGNTIEPIYEFSGNRRCIKEEGVNTGYLEIEYIDINPNSETYGNNSWISVFTQNLEYCPIGEPDRYLWGTDDISLDTDNLISTPFYIDEDDANTVSMTFTNPGGEYIYFMHLASLGLVENISTEPQDEIISSFQYLSDVEINGYLYRVLRQNYVTTEFSNYTINFTFG